MTQIVFIAIMYNYRFSFDSLESFRKRILPLIIAFLDRDTLAELEEISLQLENHNIFLGDILQWSFCNNEMAERAVWLIRQELPYYPIFRHLVLKEYIEKYTELEFYRTIPRNYQLAIVAGHHNVHLIINDINIDLSWEPYIWDHDSEVYGPELFEVAKQVFQNLGISYPHPRHHALWKAKDFNYIDIGDDCEQTLDDMKFTPRYQPHPNLLD